jgi:hypothetical protein
VPALPYDAYKAPKSIAQHQHLGMKRVARHSRHERESDARHEANDRCDLADSFWEVRQEDNDGEKRKSKTGATRNDSSPRCPSLGHLPAIIPVLCGY